MKSWFIALRPYADSRAYFNTNNERMSKYSCVQEIKMNFNYTHVPTLELWNVEIVSSTVKILAHGRETQ